MILKQNISNIYIYIIYHYISNIYIYISNIKPGVFFSGTASVLQQKHPTQVRETTLECCPQNVWWVKINHGHDQQRILQNAVNTAIQKVIELFAMICQFIWIRWIDGFASFAHLDHIIEIGDGFQNMFQITNQPCIAMFSNLSRREIIWNQRGAPVLDQIRVSQNMSWDLSDSLKSRMS